MVRLTAVNYFSSWIFTTHTYICIYTFQNQVPEYENSTELFVPLYTIVKLKQKTKTKTNIGMDNTIPK